MTELFSISKKNLYVVASLTCLLFGLFFLLGARFGGRMFAEELPAPVENIALNPLSPTLGQPTMPMRLPNLRAPSVNALTNVEEEGAPEAEADAEAVRFKVGAQGQLRQMPEDPQVAADVPLERTKPLLSDPSVQHTMIRFKSSQSSSFSIQVGEFFDEVLASKKIGELKRRGVDAYLVLLNTETESPSYAVRIGSFDDRTMAEQSATGLAERLGARWEVVEGN